MIISYLGWLLILGATTMGMTMHSTSDPMFLFAHGIADTHQQAFRYFNHGMIAKPFYTFDFPDATKSFLRVKRKHTAFGQEDEIACLDKTFKQVKEVNSEFAPVLYGISRGAATVFNFVALQKSVQMRAVILESPFADFNDIVQHLVHKFHLSNIPGASKIVEKIVSTIFPRYNWQGVKPIDLVEEFPKNLPVLLICSEQDQLVPAASTERLYHALRKAGCKKVYLVKLHEGRHAKLFESSEWPLYKQVVHAFYKRCGLPHDEVLAKKGEWLLKKFDNNIECEVL